MPVPDSVFALILSASSSHEAKRASAANGCVSSVASATAASQAESLPPVNQFLQTHSG